MQANDSSKFTSADGNIIYPFPDDIHVKDHVSLQNLMERYIPKTRGEQVKRPKDTKKIKTQGLNRNCQAWARFCNR
jgi:hypothetical protein